MAKNQTGEDCQKDSRHGVKDRLKRQASKIKQSRKG